MAPSVLLDPAKVSQLKELALRHGVHDLRVFGSFARGEAGPDSDLDLLVRIEYGPGVSTRLVDFVKAARELLGVPVDVLTDGSIDPRVHGPILAEARPL